MEAQSIVLLIVVLVGVGGLCIVTWVLNAYTSVHQNKRIQPALNKHKTRNALWLNYSDVQRVASGTWVLVATCALLAATAMWIDTPPTGITSLKRPWLLPFVVAVIWFSYWVWITMATYTLYQQSPVQSLAPVNGSTDKKTHVTAKKSDKHTQSSVSLILSILSCVTTAVSSCVLVWIASEETKHASFLLLLTAIFASNAIVFDGFLYNYNFIVYATQQTEQERLQATRQNVDARRLLRQDTPRGLTLHQVHMQDLQQYR
jgi:hypothetical protein